MKRQILAKAAKDLAEIEAYISTDSPEAAKAVALRLRRSFDLMTARPDAGRPTPFADIREWSVPGYPYLIPYRIRPNRIEILRIWHTRRKRLTEW